MGRSVAAKTAAAVLALLFLGSHATEAYGLHDCPRHHGPAPDSTAPEVAVTAGPDPGAGNADSSVCTCVGSCHGGAAVPMPAHAAPTGLWLPPAGVSVVRTAVGTLPLARSAYLLPFPTGPPLS